MNDSILVSIIVPCYNQAQYLPDALNSVLDQTYPYWECILVNDGSTDNTEAIALEWTYKDKRFKYFHKKNGGVSDARNFGIRHSTGKYILPLDADDFIEKIYIEKAVDFLEKNPGTGIVYCNARYFGKKTGKWVMPTHSNKRILFFNTIFCSAFFRRSDFDITNGFNSNMKHGFEDWDFWLYLIEKGIQAYKIPETLFFYRIRENSRNRSINFEKLVVLSRQIIMNHFELYKKQFRNPFIMEEYFKFRRGLTGIIIKDIIYTLKNLKFRIILFFLESKLNYYSGFKIHKFC